MEMIVREDTKKTVSAKKRCQSGFSLVELIIVVAIVAILAGVSVAVFSYIQNGQGKKSVANLSSSLEQLRVNSMTKETAQYMYLYETDDGIFMKIAPVNYSDRSGVISDSSGEVQLGNATLEFKLSGTKAGSAVTNVPLGTADIVKIAYNHSTGAFSCCNNGNSALDADPATKTFYNSIKVAKKDGTGGGNYEITLVELTGKHIVR